MTRIELVSRNDRCLANRKNKYANRYLPTAPIVFLEFDMRILILNKLKIGMNRLLRTMTTALFFGLIVGLAMPEQGMAQNAKPPACLLYTSPSPRDRG